MTPDPFQLTGQTPAEMRAEAQAAAERESRKNRAEQIQARQAKRLTGTAGDALQTTMLDEPGTNRELFT